MGGSARRGGLAGSGLPAVYGGTAENPLPGRAGGDPGPGQRPPASLARAVNDTGRPQGAAADPDRGHHRQRRGRQRARRRHHHLGRRAPDPRARRPPPPPPAPPVVLPPPPPPPHPARPPRPHS